MKQSFLLFSFTLLLNVAQSQITINADDVITIGFVAKQSTDTLPDASITPGLVGNVNWDFSALKPGEDGQYVFFDPATTPYGASFPQATLSSRVEPELFAYLIKDSEKINIIGVEGTIALLGFPIQGKLDITPGQSLIRFPATFGNSYTETSVQKGQTTGASLGLPSIDSLRLINTVTRTVEIDAYGEMTIPSGTFNTLRFNETESISSQVFYYTLGNWAPQGPPTIESNLYYNWWTIDNEGLAFPLVQMVVNPATSERTVTYLLDLTDTENLFAKGAKLFPNPATDFVNLDFEEPFSGTAEVFTLAGQKLVTQNLTSATTERIGLSTCGTGHHVLVLRKTNGDLAGYRKIQIIK